MEPAPERIRIISNHVFKKDWSTLQNTTFDFLRSDGKWQRLSREVYDRGNGVAILLYNLRKQTVILVKQFRYPVFLNGHDGFLIEATAGVLGDAAPEDRIRSEVEEETGYRVQRVQKVFEAYMSPGSVTEKLFYFVAEYSSEEKSNTGGGLEEEGEDIEVLELPIDQALDMIKKGEIQDAKAILLLHYAKLYLF